MANGLEAIITIVDQATIIPGDNSTRVIATVPIGSSSSSSKLGPHPILKCGDFCVFQRCDRRLTREKVRVVDDGVNQEVDTRIPCSTTADIPEGAKGTSLRIVVEGTSPSADDGIIFVGREMS